MVKWEELELLVLLGEMVKMGPLVLLDPLEEMVKLVLLEVVVMMEQ